MPLFAPCRAYHAHLRRAYMRRTCVHRACMRDPAYTLSSANSVLTGICFPRSGLVAAGPFVPPGPIPAIAGRFSVPPGATGCKAGSSAPMPTVIVGCLAISSPLGLFSPTIYSLLRKGGFYEEAERIFCGNFRQPAKTRTYAGKSSTTLLPARAALCS